MPRKMHDEVDTPTGPLTPNSRPNSQAAPRTTTRSTPQCHSSAESALTSSTAGSAWKAKISVDAPLVGSAANGCGPPPR